MKIVVAKTTLFCGLQWYDIYVRTMSWFTSFAVLCFQRNPISDLQCLFIPQCLLQTSVLFIFVKLCTNTLPL